MMGRVLMPSNAQNYEFRVCKLLPDGSYSVGLVENNRAYTSKHRLGSFSKEKIETIFRGEDPYHNDGHFTFNYQLEPFKIV